MNMKKTAALLTLIAGLGMGFQGTAQAEGFDIGADVVSRYVWRGAEFGDGIAAQPWLTYTFDGIGIEAGAWGSFDIDGDDANEVDLYVTVPVGPVSLTVTDYYFPDYEGGDDDVFDYGHDAEEHILEASIGYEYENLSLMAAINISGDDENSKYVEAGYGFYDKDDYTATAFIGAGDEVYTADGNAEGNFNVVNVGLTVTKDIFSASYMINPDQETSYLVLGVTLQP